MSCRSVLSSNVLSCLVLRHSTYNVVHILADHFVAELYLVLWYCYWICNSQSFANICQLFVIYLNVEASYILKPVTVHRKAVLLLSDMYLFYLRNSVLGF